MPEPFKKSNNAFLASESSLMRNAMQNRRLVPDVPYLVPILDSLSPASVVCEVGCGPGGITLDIAQRYPNLIVLGMDIDEQSIKQAKEAATVAGIGNVRYAVADAVTLSDLATSSGFEALNGGCDIVYSHATIMHTGNALQTVKQMRLASKPGGTVSMNEGDMGLFFAYPSNDGMAKFLEVLPKLGAAKGADPCVGRKLMSHAMAAGYSRDEITHISMQGGAVSRPQERQGVAYAYSEIFRDVLANPEWKKAAGIEVEDIELIKKGFAEWAKWEDGIIVWPSVIVHCVRAG